MNGHQLLLLAFALFVAVHAETAAAQTDLQNGDLLVGAGVPGAFGSTTGVIDLVRGTSASAYCASPTSGTELWNVPSQILVDSTGAVVFLAPMPSANLNYPHYGLFRCTAAGNAPALLAVLPGYGTPSATAPIPYPNEHYAEVEGLHLARQKQITINDNVNGGRPQVGTQDAYVFAVATLDPATLTRTGIKSLRYLPATNTWEDGPDPIEKYPGQANVSVPEMTNDAGDTYVAIANPGVDPVTGYGEGSIIRRIKAAYRVELTGQLSGVGDFDLRLDLFGGYLDIGGGPGQGSFADIASKSFVLDDVTVPNVGSNCPPSPGVDSSVPYDTGGHYAVLAGLTNIVFDPNYGLTVVSDSVATDTPYLTNIDLAGLDDDPSNDQSQWFVRPELGCLPQRSIKFTPIVPNFGQPGAEGVTHLVSTNNGMFGTQFQLGTVVRVQPTTDKLPVIVAGLTQPKGISAYPEIVKEGSGVAVVIRVDSPVDIVATAPDGRRIGVDPVTGQPVNDFGEDGFDSGPGEPRAFAIKNPPTGSFTLAATGTANGPYTIHVYSIDLAQTEGQHISTAGTAVVGNTDAHDFTLDDHANVAFVSVNQPPVADAGSDQTVRLGSLVTLDGSGSSDPDAGPSPLGFVWTPSSGPATIALAGSTTASPTFTPSVAGTYVVNLVVSDGQSSSSADTTVFVPILGDIDLDGDVDRNDLNAVLAARNTLATGPNDLRDLNGDGTIDALDARELVTLCTRPRCATQ